MTKVDRKLIYLKHFLENNSFNKKGVADYLNITERHLARLLNRWTEENIIVYEQGSGRGNNSTVHFITDIEALIVEDYLLNIDSYSIDSITDMMELPLSSSAKELIKSNMMRHLFSKGRIADTSGERFVDYYDKLPNLTLENNQYSFAEMTLKLNTMNRLYEVNSEGIIENSLVRFDEWSGNTLIIYLRKDVRFYDGRIMCANNVIESLERTLEMKNMKSLKKHLISIDKLATFKVSITMTQRFEIIRYILSKLNTGIYNIKDNKVYTTAPYYIDYKDEQSIVLKKNKFYFGRIGDIAEIELTSNVSRYSRYLQKNTLENRWLNDLSCMEYFMIHPKSEYLDLKKRQYIMYLIHKFIKENHSINEIASKDEVLYCDEYMEIIPEKIKIESTIKIVCSEMVPKITMLINYLKKFNIQAIAVPCDGTMKYGDIYWGRSFTEKLFFYNMLCFEPSGKWLNKLEKSRDFLDEYKHGNIDNWEAAELIYGHWMYKNAYLLPTHRTSRHVNLPSNFKNIQTNGYSALKFNQFVVKRDVRVR